MENTPSASSAAEWNGFERRDGSGYFRRSTNGLYRYEGAEVRGAEHDQSFDFLALCVAQRGTSDEAAHAVRDQMNPGVLLATDDVRELGAEFVDAAAPVEGIEVGIVACPLQSQTQAQIGEENDAQGRECPTRIGRKPSEMAQPNVERIEPKHVVERPHPIRNAEGRSHDPRQNQYARPTAASGRGGLERQFTQFAISGLAKVVFQNPGLAARAERLLDLFLTQLVSGATGRTLRWRRTPSSMPTRHWISRVRSRR
ncbi:MAG: hypothetical protein QM767_26220 [Anaeromyxobacter sp.]